MNLSNKELLFWYKKGFFPLKNENIESYIDRVGVWKQECLKTKSTSPQKLINCDLDLSWVCVERKWLWPWFLGYTLVEEGSLPKVVLSKFYPGSHEEILVHELIHVARSVYIDSPYEEIMAHLFTKKRWRYRLATLFSYPLWNISLISLFLLHGASFFFYSYFLDPIFWGISIFSQIGALFCFVVMVLRAYRFSLRCDLIIENLSKTFGEGLSKAIFLRLSPEEIKNLSSKKQRDVRGVVKSNPFIERWLSEFSSLGSVSDT